MSIKHFTTILLLIFTIVSLAGCSAGPDSKELEATVQNLLDTGFSDGLFKIQSFQRMGAYKTTGTSDKEIILVYFDMNLEFLRDYSMANWNNLNLDTLLQVVGAGSKGIDGINPAGNKKGDILIVHGSIGLTVDDKGKWILQTEKPVNSKAVQNREITALEQQSQDIEKMLEEIRKVTQERVTENDGAALTKIHTFVRVTRNRLFKRMRAKRDELIIATGHVSGTYYPLASALAEILTNANTPAYAQQTEGSVENCRMVSFNYADLAVCQSDIAKDAFEGTGLFKSEKMENLRALCSWYPEVIQIFVRADSPIKTIADLKRKRVVAGQKNSGVRINALQVFNSAGFTDDEMPEIIDAPGSAGFRILHDKKADAIFTTEAYPPRALKSATGNTPVRMLNIDNSIISNMVKANESFMPFTVNSRHFRGVGEEIKTVAVTAILVASSAMEDEKVTAVLKAQYENLQKMIKANPKGATISVKKGLDGLSIPVHDGATSFFAVMNRTPETSAPEKDK